MKRSLSVIAFLLLLANAALPQTTLTLEQSIDLGLKQNEAVAVAQRKVEASQARVAQAFSGYLPSVSLQANYGRSFSSPMQTVISGIPISFGLDEAGDTKRWQANLSQNIFTFGKLESALAMALNASKSAKEDLRRAKQDVIYNVRSSYYGVIKARKMIDLAQESLAMSNAHLDQADALLRAGMSTKADILRTRVSVANSTQGLIKARNALELATATFNNALGAASGSEYSIPDTDFSEEAAKFRPVFADLLKTAYGYRPDFRQTGLSVDISKNNVTLAAAGWLPSVFAQANYGWQNTVYSNAGINYDQTNWQVLGAASWTVFDGFNTQGKIKEAMANMAAAEANKELARRSVELDVKQAYLNFVSAKEVLSTARAGAESAKENYSVADMRYKSGLATNLEILDAQASLTRSELELLEARFDLELASAQVLKAAGILDLKGIETGLKLSVLEGQVKYVDLEGGFLGFIDSSGKKYNLTGSRTDEMLKEARKLAEGRGVKIWGYPVKDSVSIRMWGTPLEVESYEWK
ncbi:MAG: TolC family protein [Candidatus Margulisiibacteriota bacterium]